MSGFLDFEFLDFGSFDSWILGFGISGFFDFGQYEFVLSI